MAPSDPSKKGKGKKLVVLQGLIISRLLLWLSGEKNTMGKE